MAIPSGARTAEPTLTEPGGQGRMQDDESAVSHTRLAYLPALDGVRAFAVIAVMMFHGGIPHMDGGFMGVDAFFVLSGFLITSLLIGEWRQTLTIKLGAFWARRARRLLPALLLMLLFVAFFASVIVPKGTYGALRLDALSTLLYVSNWHFILINSNYFAENSATASPLLHTWSLAVEEQFYLIWPLVVLGVMHFTRNLKVLFGLCVAAAIASAVWMHTVYNGGLNTNRAYLGTDTRSQCLFIGCAIAVGLVLLAQRSHEQGRLAKGELWRPTSSAGAHSLRRPRDRWRGRRRVDLVAHHVVVVVPVFGGFLPPRPLRRRHHRRRRRRPPQHRAPLPGSGADPLCRTNLLRPLHLALADLHLAEPRTNRPHRLATVRGARGRHLRRIGCLVPPRGAPHPDGHVRQPVAGLARRPRRRRRRHRRAHRGDDHDTGHWPASRPSASEPTGQPRRHRPAHPRSRSRSASSFSATRWR